MLYKTKIKKGIVILALLSILQGCSSAEPQVHHLNFNNWNEEIISDLKNNQIDKLITDFQIFSNEFRNSKLIPGVSIKIINYLIINEKWKSALSFINNHLERYEDNLNEDYLRFLIIKIRYKLLSKPDRLQKKYIELINSINSYKLIYPKSKYIEAVSNIKDNLLLEQTFFNRDIYYLYKRMGKSKAADFYKNKYIKSGYNLKLRERPNKSPFYKKIFEGDGTPSILGYLIPYKKDISIKGKK